MARYIPRTLKRYLVRLGDPVPSEVGAQEVVRSNVVTRADGDWLEFWAFVEDVPEKKTKDDCNSVNTDFIQRNGWAGHPDQCDFAHNIIRCTSQSGHIGNHMSLRFGKVFHHHLGHWENNS